MAQLAFSWPAPKNYDPEAFVISDCNKAAVQFIDHWPGGAESAALLVGPPSSGKSHLAFRFAARNGASMLNADKLGREISSDLWKQSRFAILENIETLGDEAAFFHLLRHAETTGGHLLLTSRLHAQELPFQLPDVRSRLLALPTATIFEPDDVMLQAFFAKAFADRQWRITPNVLNYIALRTERSYAAAQKLILCLEQLIITTHREVTIPLVKPLVE